MEIHNYVPKEVGSDHTFVFEDIPDDIPDDAEWFIIYEDGGIVVYEPPGGK